MPDELFFAAARDVADEVSDGDFTVGRVCPAPARIRGVSLVIATRVAEIAREQGISRGERPGELEAHSARLMFEPKYARCI